MFLLLGVVQDAQNKVDHDSQQENNGQDGRAETIVETSLSPHSYGLCSPVICDQRVDHGQHGDSSEQERRDEGDTVTKVEHANGQGANNDSKVEP